MINISNEQLIQSLGFSSLIEALRDAFRGNYTTILKIR